MRWVIAKAEHTDKGSNPRFILTNIVGDAQRIYDRRYCQRGEMKNRIKEQMMLFARSGQRASLVAQPVATTVVGSGLYADGSAAAPGVGRHRAGAGDLCDDPHQADQDRRGGRHQADRHPPPPQLAPSVAGTLLSGPRRACAAMIHPALHPAPSTQWGLGVVSTHPKKHPLQHPIIPRFREISFVRPSAAAEKTFMKYAG